MHTTSPRQVNTICNPDLYGDSDPLEIQSFEFFIRRVLPGFTRILDDHFWHQTIPQLSRIEPLVWNAVIAMSSLIRYPQYSTAPVLPGSTKTPVTDGNHRKALIWYGKSIAGVKERIKSEKTWSSLALITCILYTSIECLQDNIVEAYTLYQRAVGMAGLVTTEYCGYSSTTLSERSLEDRIRVLLRHETMSHGLLVPRPKLTLDSAAGRFDSLSDAREELYALVTETQAFVQHVNAKKNAYGKEWIAPSDIVTQQEDLQTNLLRWHSAFSNTTASPGAVSGPNDGELSSVLLLAYGQYFIWLSACLSTFETAYDQFFQHFQLMIEHADHVIAATRAEVRPVFVLESRVIASLYFIAIKCRQPSIRRRAVVLLRNGPQVENIWKAEPMAVVAERTIGVEESGSEHGVYHAQALSSDLPPESSRVYRQEVVELKDNNGQLCSHLILNRWYQNDAFQWSKAEHIVKI